MNDFVSDLPRIRSLVAEFEKLPASVTLLAQWDIPGDLRVNDTFVVSGKVMAYSPTVPSGFVPSSSAKPFASLEESLRPIKLAPVAVIDIIKLMAELHLAALQRSPQGVRVIRSGLADNHSALLLLKPDAKPPHQGEDLGNGLQVNGGTKIDERTYYYETS